MEVIDLDDVVPEPKRAKLSGVEYELPSDLPMEIFLRINQAARATDEDGNPDQGKQMELLMDAMGDLFGFEATGRGDHDAANSIKEKVLAELRRRSLDFSFKLTRRVYGAVDEKEPGESPPDQAPEEGALSGTKSSTTSQSPATTTVIPAAAAASSA